MEEVKDSIDKEAHLVFKLAVMWVANKYGEELYSTECKKINFCALNYEKSKKACKVTLNGSLSRSKYIAALTKSLEILDNWVTSHPSEDLKAAWDNNCYSSYLETCVKDVERNTSYHILMELGNELF